MSIVRSSHLNLFPQEGQDQTHSGNSGCDKKRKNMLQILKFTEGNVVATKATGKLVEADYEELLPVLNEKVGQYDKVRWYLELDNFDGLEGKAFWQDEAFDVSNLNDFERVAMVGEKKWEVLMTDLMKPFTSAEVKYFEPGENEEAERWVRG